MTELPDASHTTQLPPQPEPPAPSKKRFRDEDFAEPFPTHSRRTPHDCARFVNGLIRLVQSGFSWNAFTMPLYFELTNHYGHIAHTNVHEFYDRWFSSAARRAEWCQYICRGGFYEHLRDGLSPVEIVFMMWLQASPYPAYWQAEAEYQAAVAAASSSPDQESRPDQGQLWS